jgi:hypothetical protein
MCLRLAEEAAGQVAHAGQQRSHDQEALDLVAVILRAGTRRQILQELSRSRLAQAALVAPRLLQGLTQFLA